MPEATVKISLADAVLSARHENDTAAGVLIGWFGKIPDLGDFASRRLPDIFVRRWDRWLQRGLAHARAERGDAWIEGYLVAPIQRFWLTPGMFGDSGWAGLVMPSMDRVGRHFPLTLARPMDTLATALAAHDWYRELDKTARRVLDFSFTVDDLEGALLALDPPPAFDGDESIQLLAGRLATAAPSSIWWCGDANEHTPFLCVHKLPTAQMLASMWDVVA